MTDRTPLVTPFIGVRYAESAGLDRRIAPPYDVIAPDERDRFAEQDAYNVVHYILPEGGEDRYARAAATVTTWMEQRVLAADAAPSVTVVHQEFTTPDGRQFRRSGVIAAVAAESFDGGRVRPHERTHEGPKEDRLALLRASRFVFESLLMLAADRDDALQTALRDVQREEPLMSVLLDDVRITTWRVEGEAARDIAAAAGRDSLYIADGHHRYETAVAYGTEYPGAARVPALIVPIGDPGLVVWPTHRMLYGAPIRDDTLEAALRPSFQIKELRPETDLIPELRRLATRGTACVIVLPPRRRLAVLLKGAKLGDLGAGVSPVVASLDVKRIEELVLKPLVASGGQGATIGYSPDHGEVEEAVRVGRAAAGVLLNPTAVTDVLAVADAGEFMPQKSTYFHPKVPSGLVGLRYDS